MNKPAKFFLCVFILSFYLFAGNCQNVASVKREVSVSRINTPVNAVAFSPDGTKLVYCLKGGVVKLWNLSANEFKTIVHPKAANVAIFSPDGNSIAVGCEDNTAYIWNLDGKLQCRIKGHGAIINNFTELRDPWGVSDVKYTEDGLLITSSQDQTCKFWKVDSTATLINSYKVSSENTGPLSCDVYKNHLIIAGRSGQAEVHDGQKMISLSSRNVSSVAFSSLGAYFSTASLVEVDIRTYNFEDPSKPAQGSTGIVRIWSKGTGKLVSEINVERPTKIIFSPDEKTILIGNEKGNISLWTVDGKKVKEFVGHSAEVTALSFNNKGNRFASGSLDGTLKLWNIDGKQIASLYSDVEEMEKFIIVSETGYYYSSTREVEGFNFIINNKAYGFEQFDMLYNRPDIVLRELGYVSEAKINAQKALVEKRMEVMGVKNVSSDPDIPQLKVNWVKQGSPGFVSSTPDFVFSVDVQTTKTPLKSIFLSVNGIPLYGKTGLPVAGLKVSKELYVSLSAGKNVIAVSAMTENGIESAREEKMIFYEKEEGKPKLFFIGVGSGKFSHENEKNKLNAAKDVNDVVEAVKKNKAAYFSEIVPLLLFDEAVVGDNLVSIRKELLLKSKVDDIVVLYFVGHGFLDSNKSLILSSYSVDFFNPSSGGIPYESLDKILDSIPARNRLILLNACASGEYNSQQDLFTAMSNQFYDLRRNSGAYVISSSTGDKPSYFPDGSNSYFTSALLKIIGTEGSLNVLELKNNIYKNITRQVPTLRQYNAKNNFRLW